jgi:hypothetical protein
MDVAIMNVDDYLTYMGNEGETTAATTTSTPYVRIVQGGY